MSSHLKNIEGMTMEGKLPEVRLANTPFRAVSPYEPSGDQPQAIKKLAQIALLFNVSAIAYAALEYA